MWGQYAQNPFNYSSQGQSYGAPTGMGWENYYSPQQSYGSQYSNYYGQSQQPSSYGTQYGSQQYGYGGYSQPQQSFGGTSAYGGYGGYGQQQPSYGSGYNQASAWSFPESTTHVASPSKWSGLSSPFPKASSGNSTSSTPKPGKLDGYIDKGFKVASGWASKALTTMGVPVSPDMISKVTDGIKGSVKKIGKKLVSGAKKVGKAISSFFGF